MKNIFILNIYLLLVFLAFGHFFTLLDSVT